MVPVITYCGDIIIINIIIVIAKLSIKEKHKATSQQKTNERKKNSS